MLPRRFSLAPLLFFALWAVWFLLPSTGEVARSQWKARFVPVPTAEHRYGAFVPHNDTSRDASLVRALNTGMGFPDNPRRRALEQLGRLYPDDAAICAAQLVGSVTELQFYHIRFPGPYSSTDPNWSVKLPTFPRQKPSPALLKSWFAATARGAKLEPNNTFWDWMQIIGLLADTRDDEVWPALRAASKKTGYDDHVAEWVLARLRVARQQRMMPPMSQIEIGFANFVTYDSTMREAGRQLSDNASGLRLLGGAAQQKQALEGMRDLAQLASVMRRESKSSIESLVASSIEAIALYGGSYTPIRVRGVRKARIGAPVAAYGSDPRSLLFFARKMGRNDIASQLGNEWVEIGTWQAKTRPVMISSGTLIGLNMRDVAVAQGADWFGTLMVAGIPALLAVVALCSLLLRFVPALRRESGAWPSPLSWGWGVFLSVASLVVLSSVGLYALWATWHNGRTTALDLLLAPLSGAFNNAGGAVGVPFVWQAYFPAVLGVLSALWLASLWDTRERGKPTLGTRLRRLFRAPDDGVAHFDLSPLLALTGTIGAFFLIVFGVVGFLIAPSIDLKFGPLHNYAGFVLSAFVLVWAFPYALRLRSARGRAFALILVRRLAWGQLLFITILWGVLWLVAMPAQRRFEADFNHQLQVGEFQLIRQQVGL